MRKTLFALCLFLTACVGVPDGITPVSTVDAERYDGLWYEVARLDNRFERGLSNVTAEYALREDGGLTVTNRGYKDKSAKWEQAKGKAYFVEDGTGHLKVSFFGPFYASYVVFDLDQDYQYAFVAGNSRDVLWLLAREPEISDEIKDKFIARTTELDFDLENLIWVSHDKVQISKLGEQPTK